MSHIYKVCQNKGNARVWLEGKRLSDAGWSKGDRFNKELGYKTMVLYRNTEGKHRIAGKDERPIIDMNGKYMTEFFQDSTHYHTSFEKDTITITRI